MVTEAFTGVVLTDDNQRIYLIKEDDKNKIGQDRWNLPGGSIDEAEGIVASAERETLEETGYKAKAKAIVGCYQGTKGGKTWLYVVVSADLVDSEKTSIIDSSVKEGRWFTKEEFLKMDIAQMVHPDMKLVYQTAIGGKGLSLESVKFINYDKE